MLVNIIHPSSRTQLSTPLRTISHLKHRIMGDEYLTKSVNNSGADTTKHAKHVTRDAPLAMDLQYIMSHNAEEETRHEKRKFYIPGTNKPRDGTESSCCHSPPREGKRFRIAGQVGQKIARDNPPASLTPDLGYLRFDEPPLLESSKPLLSVPPAPALGPTTTFQATTPRSKQQVSTSVY